EIEVKLRNLEYDLTRTIKKLVYGFQPLENLFARVSGNVTMNVYVTPKTLPDNLKEIPKQLAKIAGEIAQRSGGKFVFNEIDPSDPGKEKLRQELFDKYGFRPMASSLFSQEVFYLHVLISAGDSHERVYLAPDASEADIRSEVTAALKRLTPGFLKTVGLLTTEPPRPPMNPMMQRQPPPPDTHQLLQSKLSESYTVKKVDLKDGRVPGDVDILILVGPEDLDEKQQYAVDQFLMRGGAAVVCSGKFVMEQAPGVGLAVKKINNGIDKMLESWGIKVLDQMVLDRQNQAFPIPVQRNIGGFSVQEIQLLPYPFFVDVRQNGMADDNVVVSGLPSVTMQWVSPLELTQKEKIKTTVLLKSTDQTWTQEQTQIQPDFQKHPETGFGAMDDKPMKSQVLAVSLTGVFDSFFTDKPSPIFAQNSDEKQQNTEAKTADASSRTIKASPDTARLSVVGSSEFINDVVLGLSRQIDSELYKNNLQFFSNLVDWSVADVDLLSISSRGSYARTLRPMQETEKAKWEWINYGLTAVLLALVVFVAFSLRRRIRPMELVRQNKKGAE
ncbi:MAG: Gldg family protein, partial [Pseudomonadota bacterium]